MTLRKLIFWPHLATGLLAGLVILVMSVTGVLLTYEKQIVRWAEWDSAAAAAPPAAAGDASAARRRLPVDELVARVTAARASAAAPSNITVYADPAAPVLLSFGRDERVFANGYTGAITGTGAPRLRAFFRGVTDWHRWLARAGDSRAAGKAVTGAGNLAFLFLIVSGVYLWFPRKWSWPAVKAVTVPRLRLAGKARDWNWHNALAFWAAAPLLIIVVSGAVISYTWAGDLVYRAVGSQPPPRRSAGPAAQASSGGAREGDRAAREPRAERAERGERGERGERRDRAEGAQRGDGAARQQRRGRDLTDGAAMAAAATSVPSADLQALWAAAERQQPGWTSISHGWPLVRDGKATFTLDTGTGAQPQHKTQLTLDAASAAVVKADGWAQTERGRKARSILRFAHTGEILGLFGQTLAGLASFAAVVLVYTGFALSCRRFFPRRQTSPVASPVPAEVDPRDPQVEVSAPA